MVGYRRLFLSAARTDYEHIVLPWRGWSSMSQGRKVLPGMMYVLHLWPLQTWDGFHCLWPIHMYILVLSFLQGHKNLPLWGWWVCQHICFYCDSSWEFFASERVQTCSNPHYAWVMLQGFHNGLMTSVGNGCISSNASRSLEVEKHIVM